MRTLDLIYKIIMIILIFIMLASIINILITQKNESTVSAAYIIDEEDMVEPTPTVAVNNTVTNDDNIIEDILDDNTIIEPVIIENNHDEHISPDPSEEDEVDETLPIDEYSEKEIYELAKIIMCEAEGESQKCKEYIGQVILNRVDSNKFPDTIHDVIFDGHQFTPTFDGRWEKVEPNQDCYDAAYTVINSSEPLTEALYFEACKGSSWHSRNLTKIAKIDGTRFYIE